MGVGVDQEEVAHAQGLDDEEHDGPRQHVLGRHHQEGKAKEATQDVQTGQGDGAVGLERK